MFDNERVIIVFQAPMWKATPLVMPNDQYQTQGVRAVVDLVSPFLLED